jgi:hypothetical protein
MKRNRTLADGKSLLNYINFHERNVFLDCDPSKLGLHTYFNFSELSSLSTQRL